MGLNALGQPPEGLVRFIEPDISPCDVTAIGPSLTTKLRSQTLLIHLAPIILAIKVTS